MSTSKECIKIISRTIKAIHERFKNDYYKNPDENRIIMEECKKHGVKEIVIRKIMKL